MNTNRIDPSPRIARRALAVLALSALAAFTARAQTPLPTSGNGWTLVQTGSNWTLNDVVDGPLYTGSDHTVGWSAYVGGVFSTGAGGLVPTEGTGFFAATNTSGSTADRAGQRFFSGLTVQEGTYTVTVSIGDLNNRTFQPPTVYLLGDSANNGFSYGDRFVGVASASNTAPADGAWTTWTYTFSVSSTTMNVNTTPMPVVNTPLGILIRASTLANAGYAFDSVQISFVSASAIPEPAATSALAGGALLAAAFVIRRRRSSLRR